MSRFNVNRTAEEPFKSTKNDSSRSARSVCEKRGFATTPRYSDSVSPKALEAQEGAGETAGQCAFDKSEGEIPKAPKPGRILNFLLKVYAVLLCAIEFWYGAGEGLQVGVKCVWKYIPIGDKNNQWGGGILPFPQTFCTLLPCCTPSHLTPTMLSYI